MHTQHIRQMIGQAVAHEQMTGTAAQTLVQAAVLRGIPTNPMEVAQTVEFIRGYVESAPQLLEDCAAAASTAGVEDSIFPILGAAEQYFLSPLDVIYDHLGLIGLMDDAYFTQCLLQAVSDSYEAWTGSPLLAADLAPANAVVRQLIGEPHASQLDLAIQSTLQQGNVQQAFRRLTEFQGTLPVEPAWADPDAEMPANPLGYIDPSGGAPPASSPGPLDPARLEVEGASNGADTFEATYQMVMQLFKQKAEAGEFTPGRQQKMAAILEELGELERNPEDAAGEMSRMAKIRELLGRMVSAVEDPTHEDGAAPEGSRAETVGRLLGRLKRYLVIEASRPNKPSDQRDVVGDLFVRAMRASTAVNQAGGNDGAVYSLEREMLRRLALDVRSYAMLHHLTLARPIWPAPAVVPDANAVFFSGTSEIERIASDACDSRGLTLLRGAGGKNYARARWERLRRSSVALFDFGIAEPARLAAVAYELGIALALGRNVIVLSSGGTLPFDVDVVPLWLQGDAKDVGRLADALDDAIYSQQRGGGDTSIPETLEYAKRAFATDRFEIRHTLELLEEAAPDPVRVNHMIPELLGSVGREAPIAIHPAWPGSYPVEGAKRCFHIMPFSLDWSDAVMAIAAVACDETGTEYVRGDEVSDARIIRSIWDEICQASHLLVDLTDFNANVALELGIAHVLGRNTLVVGQDDTVERLFPALAKLRVQPYSLDSGGSDLHEAVSRFLG